MAASNSGSSDEEEEVVTSDVSSVCKHDAAPMMILCVHFVALDWFLRVLRSFEGDTMIFIGSNRAHNQGCFLPHRRGPEDDEK